VLNERLKRLIDESRELRAQSARLLDDSRRLRLRLGRIEERDKAVDLLRRAA